MSQEEKSSSYPDPSQFINDESIDLSSYVSAINDHDQDDLVGIIKSSQEAQEILSQQNFADFLSEAGNEAYTSIKNNTAEDLGAMTNGVIQMSHYKSKFHEDSKNRETFLRNFISNKTKYLEGFGHSDFNHFNVDELEGDSLEKAALSVARDVSLYHGPVELGGEQVELSDLLSNTVLNQGAKDLTFGQVYATLSQYMEKAAKNIPQAITSGAVSLASAKHQRKKYQQRISAIEQATKGLGIPLKEDVNEFQLGNDLGVPELKQLYKLSSTDLSKQFEDAQGAAKLIDPSKLYKDAA